MKGPLSFAIFVLIVAWGLYRCYRKKNELACYGILGMCCGQLSFYPFWLPHEFVFAGVCLLGCGALTYKVFHKKYEKNVLFFAGIFLVLSLYFLSQGLLIYNRPR